MLLQYVFCKENNLVQGQEPQLEISCIGMKILSRYVSNGEIAFAFSYVIFHIGPFIVEAVDVIFLISPDL